METSRWMELRGRPIYARDGDEIGKVGDIYLDDDTEEPVFVGVQSGGLLGAKHVLVPLEGASAERDGIGVRYAGDLVRGAPDIDEEHVTPEQMSELYAYYQLQGDGGMPRADAHETTGNSSNSDGVRWGDSGMEMVDRTPGYGTDAEEQAGYRRSTGDEKHRMGPDGVPGGRPLRIRKWVESGGDRDAPRHSARPS